VNSSRLPETRIREAWTRTQRLFGPRTGG
jgi:hypothetical protein